MYAPPRPREANGEALFDYWNINMTQAQAVLVLDADDGLPGEPRNRANARSLEAAPGLMEHDTKPFTYRGMPNEEIIERSAGVTYGFIRYGTITRDGYEAVKAYKQSLGYDIANDALLIRMRKQVERDLENDQASRIDKT